MPDLGMLFYYNRTRGPSQLASLAHMLEEEGVSHAFTCEAFNDAMVPLASMAAATKRITIGPAVANLAFRHPYCLAGAAASVNELAQGRFVLGIGPGHAAMNSRGLGLDMRKPVSRTRDYVVCVRALLDGCDKPVDVVTERFQVRNLPLAWAPVQRVPILLAALRPAMVRLAGEIGDGVVLSNVPLRAIPQLRRVLDESARAHGRDPSSVSLFAIVNTILRPSREEARHLLADAYSAAYLGLEYYQQSLASYGVEIREGLRLGDEDLDALAIGGPLEYARERLTAYREAGVDLPILAPMGVLLPKPCDTDLEATYSRLALLAA